MIDPLSLPLNTPRKRDTLSQFSDNIFQSLIIMTLHETLVSVFGKGFGLYSFCYYCLLVLPEVLTACPRHALVLNIEEKIW
jgi:hypothetical protein